MVLDLVMVMQNVATVEQVSPLFQIVRGGRSVGARAGTPDRLVSQRLAVRRYRDEYQQHGNAGQQMQVHRSLQRTGQSTPKLASQIAQINSSGESGFISAFLTNFQIPLPHLLLFCCLFAEYISKIFQIIFAADPTIIGRYRAFF